MTDWLDRCHFGDVRDVLDYPWDLMIAHPPCTHLSVSGARHFEAKRMDGRQQSAVSFFMMLAKVDIPMFDYCHDSCCMGSGGDEAKAAAKYVTDDVDRDGLYNAFVHYALIEK